MRYKLLRGGVGPALASLALLGHPPATASTIMLRSAICGSTAQIDIPIKRGRRRPDSERSCPAGCHVAGMARRRALAGGGA